jgi:hypothetical protein
LFFDVQILLKNPTPSSIKINHIFIEISASGNVIGGVTKPDDFTISANSATDVNFTARIQTGGAITTFIALFQSQQPPVLSAAGYIDTSAGRIPFNKTF